MVNKLKHDFIEIFNRESEDIFFSPGRVNLIGEHTDYNGGHVFPCALSFGTYGVAARREDRKVRMYSINFEQLGVIEFDLDNIVYDEKDDWANYPKGVIKVLQERNYEIEGGLDILVFGNIPNGAGLSSSASIEVLTGVIFNHYNNLNIDMIDIVKISQEAENKFIGVSCGIMDQFSIGMGQKDCAILLDCNTLNYRYSHINLDGYKIVIANSNKRRGLADSKYNERCEECANAKTALKKELNFNELGELSEEVFDKNAYLIENEVERKRARHAVYENQRTLKAVKALEENDIELFGKLMIASDTSLREDYEVTGLELDTLVAVSLEQDGVIGSRMTGAGFGGCTVSIVKEDAVENFIENVTKSYEDKIGYKPDFYVADISDGARKIG
ncbi:galactokinase [Romboutsia weinsteinii]|uniref:Galactokinase n=1 Tax=Romboutsia weinsteinii TaxID=2020949 RepID=A0A371J1E3_9FIRM|nr:galactokinase [Romboutsia weinsteinii]RDY26523.1 galactokinase [Romboutsia weinsteinii]